MLYRQMKTRFRAEHFPWSDLRLAQRSLHLSLHRRYGFAAISFPAAP